jgi:hypothetical protein
MQCSVMHLGHPSTMESFSRWIKVHVCSLGNALCAFPARSIDHYPKMKLSASWDMGDDVSIHGQ